MGIHDSNYDRFLIHTQKRVGLLLVACIVIIGLFLLYFEPPVAAQCVDISDTPMDTKIQSAPSNIMFVLDDSGSMDWEYMVEGAADGKFQGNIEYVFDDPGDNVYKSEDNSTILSGSERGKWKAQWSGHNRLYFNPKSHYQPWPGMSNADTSNPRSNPNNSSPTFDLTAEYFSIQTAVIVDDQDPAPDFSKTGIWGHSTNSQAYEDDYYCTNQSNQDVTATWVPDLGAGEHDVYARWVENDYRSQAVPYTITHSGGSTTVYVNQRENGGIWYHLGTFHFDQGQGPGIVAIDYHVGDNNQYRVCAGAIKFVPTHATSISIKNAHYYTWDDADEDGELGDGEAVYFVNFVAGAREYYMVTDVNGNDIVESGELVLISVLPDSVKPAFYDEDGAFIAYKTDAEDLQNLANWYSFYRRRELTAKAAVAHSISSLVGVQVGFYSINGGLRQSVLPVKLDMPGAVGVIVDNKDSGYVEIGSWAESSCSNEYENSSRYTYTSGSEEARWTPNLPQTGGYNVYAWWNYWSTRDTNALYEVHHQDGTYSVRKNQQQDYSQWTLLGTFVFDAGTSGKVVVKRDGASTGGSTSADAVKFEWTGGETGHVDNTNTLLNALYGLDSSGETPLRLAVKNVGRYYHQDDGNDGGLGPSPYASAEDGGACQHSFAIVMTDGYWNGEYPDVGNQDGPEGSPYADSNSDTLADVVMKYYKEDLSTGLNNVVPTSSCDKATHQHMVTYSVSFGVTGSLNSEDYHPYLLDDSTPPWPNPTFECYTCPKKIDDLWHAAVNGRGLFFNAGDPAELIDSLKAVMQNIASRAASGASVTVNGEELGTNTVLYQSSYISDGWTGDVTAYPIDPVTGEIKKETDDILWNASDELQSTEPDDRRIVVYNGTSAGAPFRFDELTEAQKTALDDDPAVAQNIVSYVRGEEIEGFRPRTKKLGDIVHSAPLLVGNTIFAGGNDGMLHAFNANNGTERFAYIPNLVFDNLNYLKDNDYQHKFYVDSTPFSREAVGTMTLLVGGLGKGGKGYYALDVTSADSVNSLTTEAAVASMVKWEYPKAGTTDDDLGYTFSQAFIVKTCCETPAWVVVFGNGYDSVNGKAVLYVLDVDGALVKKIDTGVGGCNGLSTPSVVDVNGDYKVDYAYAGDLKGNLWKFDLTDPDPAKWAVAFNDGTNPQPLFQATGQPITTKPDVMRHCEKHGYMVVFGTGKYLGDTDCSDISAQTIYGIWDYGDDLDNSEYLGAFNRGSTPELFNQPNTVTLLKQTEVDWRTVYGHDLRTLSDNKPVWETKDDMEGQLPDLSDTVANNAGWYFDLPITGERIVRDVMIRDGTAIVISVIPNESPCFGGGSSIVHEMNACTGGRFDEARFDINNDGKIDENDFIGIVDDEGNPILVPPTGISYTGMLYTSPIIRMPDEQREMKIFSTSAGTTETLFEAAERRGLFYWRER